MKLCQKHVELMTGDGECWQCMKDQLHELILKQQLEVNLGNAVIIDQRKQIKDLQDQLQGQRQQIKELLKN
jgi:hypothetical protein